MKKRNSIAIHIVLIAFSFIVLWPFIQMFLTSLMTLEETMMIPPVLVPEEAQWSNYSTVVERMDLALMYLNSIIVAILTTIGVVLTCTMAGYVFAKIKFKGSNILFGIVILIMLVPGQMFMLPQYQTMVSFEWVNTLRALIVPNWFSAYGIFMMRQFFKSIPDELIEAALMDGYSHLKVYFRIAMPLIKPGVMVFAIQTIIGSWNSLLWPIVVNSDPSKYTLPVGMAMLNGERFTNTAVVMAGAVLVTIPMLVLYIFGQKYFKNIDLSLK